MRCLILGVNYLPESAGIGPFTADLAEHLQAAGHTVRVVTAFPMLPQWQVWEGYRGSWFRREVINGVPVTRTLQYVPENPRRPLKRVLYDTSFSASALFGGLGGRYDVVVAVVPPIQLGVTAWML